MTPAEYCMTSDKLTDSRRHYVFTNAEDTFIKTVVGLVAEHDAGKGLTPEMISFLLNNPAVLEGLGAVMVGLAQIVPTQPVGEMCVVVAVRQLYDDMIAKNTH